MKVKIDSDEWYPVYCVSPHGDEVDVPDSQVADWKRVFAEFERVQREMIDLCEKEAKRREQEAGR
jgi:hypothetical protein